MKTLLDAAPREFADEFVDTPAWRYRDRPVLHTHRVSDLTLGSPADWSLTRWPGREKYVSVWWELAGGVAVGWNENPNRGWSFPVVRWPRRGRD